MSISVYSSASSSSRFLTKPRQRLTALGTTVLATATLATHINLERLRLPNLASNGSHDKHSLIAGSDADHCDRRDRPCTGESKSLEKIFANHATASRLS